MPVGGPSPLSLTPLRLVPDEVALVVDLYESNPEYGDSSGEYAPGQVSAEWVEAELREDVATGSDVLLAREADGNVVGLVSILRQHRDGHPWIGLLIVHGDQHGRGHGRVMVDLVEQNLRAEDRPGIRLAVLENNPKAFAFWTSLGWQEIDRRPDLQHGRPCIVMHKDLG
jgi:ribosomal protein S18 acetylase RimI-like enzyme